MGVGNEYFCMPILNQCLFACPNEEVVTSQESYLSIPYCFKILLIERRPVQGFNNYNLFTLMQPNASTNQRGMADLH